MIKIKNKLCYINSYSTIQVGIFVEETQKPMCLVESHVGGLTHLMFSEDGSKLYSGARKVRRKFKKKSKFFGLKKNKQIPCKDSDIYCWDMRNLGQVLQVYHRNVKTNQRIYFDILKDFNYLGTGNDDGKIRLFDLNENDEKEFYVQKMHDDCLNGLNFHPTLPLLATASGQRKFLKPKSLTKASEKTNDSESSDSDSDSNLFENSLKIWKYSFDKINIT
jgi:WD40 repeat protein